MKLINRFVSISFILTLFIFPLYAQTYRDSIDVVKYDIHLKIDPYTKYIQGYTDITLTSKYNLNKIGLDLWGMYIDSILTENQNINKYKYTSTNFYFSFFLKSNDTIKIRVYYHGNPLKDPFWGGFYFNNLYAFNYGIGLRSNPPSLGRCWFPSNDSFSDKALFEFYITTDSTQKAVCNGILIDTIVNDYWITWHWKLNQPIPTYLANVAVGRYKKFGWTYHGKERNIPVEIYLMKNQPDSAIKSLTHLNQVMNIFENLFGEYQWDKIGYVAVPMSLGAMEHATNISIPNHALNGTLIDEPLLFHELSHSWFGNLVTCKTTKDIWINEGFAEYASILYSEYLYGKDEFKKRMREKHLITLNFAHKEDKGYKAIGKITFPNIYGKTIYDKGADVVNTLRYQIGDSLFWAGIKNYLKTYAFSNASIDDLRQSLEHFTGMDLKDWFDYWIYTPGFPHFSITNINVKKSKGQYSTIVEISQKIKESDKYLKGQRLEIGFIGKDQQYLVKETFIQGKTTLDTFYLPFKPVLAVIDPNEHIAEATTQEAYWIKKQGTYIFDYEFLDLQVKEVSKTTYFRVTANWIAPEQTLIQNNRYLLNSTYYWTIQNNADKDFKASAKFYLSSLMDYNFLNLNEKQLKGIKLFYRKDEKSPWQIINAQLSDDYQYLESDNIQAGDYIIGLDRTIK